MQRIDGHSDGQVGLACARGADANHDLLLGDLIYIALLAARFRCDDAARTGQHDLAPLERAGRQTLARGHDVGEAADVAGRERGRQAGLVDHVSGDRQTTLHIGEWA